jgi:hypothetical protein
VETELAIRFPPLKNSLAVAKIGYVHVGAEPDVVCKVPAVVVRIFVDDDLIRIPKPVVGESEIIRSNAEIKAPEPEPRRAASGEVEDVATTKPAREPAVLPGMVEVVMGVIAAGVVADPLIVGMDVGRVRMSASIAEVGMFGGRVRIASDRSGTVGRYVPAANAV